MHIRKAPPTDGYPRAALLGFVAGLRSQTPLFLLALAARRGDFARNAGKPLSFLRSRGTLIALAVLWLGELVGDKLPTTPSRLKPIQLGGRLIMGALAGAAITSEAGASTAAGSVVGAAATGAGSVAGNRFRMFLPRLTGFPDTVGAIVEDATALGLGWFAIIRRQSS